MLCWFPVYNGVNQAYCGLVAKSFPTLCLPVDCSPPGKNPGVNCRFPLQQIFPTQGLNLRFLHCRWSTAFQAESSPLSHQESPKSAMSIHMSFPSWASFSAPPPPLPLSYPLGCHRARGWAPCFIQQLPTSYLFYTWRCMYSSATFSFPHSLLPLLGAQVHPLCLCLCSCTASRFTNNIFFLDYIYMG